MYAYFLSTQAENMIVFRLSFKNKSPVGTGLVRP